MNDPTMSLPVVTSVFSLSIKQEEDLPFLDNPESETSELINLPVTGSPNVKPEILIRFKEQGFSTEPQELEERGNLPNADTCEQLYETDEGFRNNSKTMRLCSSQQREEWKHKDPSKDSPDPSADYIGDTANQDKLLNCSECDKCLGHEGKIQQHKTAHAGNCPRNKPFKCSECDKCFSRKAKLQQHKMTHTGHKPFKCSECDKYFRWKQSLQRHEITHTLEKPFICSQCNKCFNQKGNLQRHKMTHTGVKPFKCFQCDKCFSQKSKMLQHTMIHTGLKPFKCFECNKCFSQKSKLQRHKMTHVKWAGTA
ncbi:oocyte zinc finger protein XlCOF6.1-like [Microcaecilia unicolor]|uniref:Oocyte zinc finger protein XlCOF6.1-like n=1 Tax=Microcaecilia unicolor TaxID=1415580 RepID=A0A6P7XAW8_9AMPH|nr:oocyte zinc finger protein XlCOF6.1-like [Microcaecilia unicolor]